MKRLVDFDAYVTGEMSDADADALDESMFAAPDDPNLALIDRIAHHGAKLVEHGTYDIGCTTQQIEDLRRAGHDVQVVIAGPPGGPPEILTLSRTAELIATGLPLGRTDIDLVDVEITVLEYNVTKTIKDVRVDTENGIVYGLCERPLAHLALTAGPTLTRVRHARGDRDVIAEWHIQGQLA